MSLLERKATPYFRFGCIRLFCLLWATLQFDSKLVLIDPGTDDPQSIPKVVRSVALPSPAKGPHGVIEDGDDLWTSCEDSHHAVRINPDRPGDHFIFPCNPRPVFVAIHPTSRDVYATLDQLSEIFRINRSGSAEEQGKTESIPIPADLGSTPVGMIPGPDGNLWCVLLGNSNGRQGRCARILADGDFEWFQIKTGPAAGASLIHLGFSDPLQPAAPSGTSLRLFLLGSSMAAATALNAVFDIGLSSEHDILQIESQQTIAIPST